MGAASGSPLVLNSLSDPDPDIVRATVSFLSRTRLHTAIGLLIPLDQAAAAQALRPFLAAADPGLRKSAAEALCRLLAIDLVQELRPLLAHEDQQVRQVALYHLSLYHGDATTWAPLRALFFAVAPGKRYWIVRCLTGFAACSDKSVKGDVAIFAYQRLIALYGLFDIESANEAFNLLHVLETLAPAWERIALEEIAAAPLAPWVRAIAVERLVKHGEGSPWEGRLLALLDDPTMVDSVYPIICKMGTKAKTPAIIDRLRVDIRSAKSYQRLIDIVDAFIAIDLGDDSELGNVVDRLESRHRFEIITRRDRVTAGVMLEHLDRAELLVGVGSDIQSRFKDDWLGTDRYLAILGVLGNGKRFHLFDCKGFTGSHSYTALIAELFALGGADIDADRITLADAPDGTYLLTVDFGPRPIVIELKDRGRWFDLDRLLAGLNGLLSDLWPSLQYYAVATVDQYGLVILTDAKAMEIMISELAFPIEARWGA